MEDNKNNPIKECVKVNKHILVKKNDSMFDPFLIHKDSLFWCFYVLLFGIDKYELIGNQHFVEEKKIKFEYIEILRKKKDVLKMHKIKPLSEIEDDLANKEAIGIKTFIALCVIVNINIMIIDNHKYYESINNDNSIIHIIYRHTKPLKFVMDLESPADKIEYYRTRFLQLPTFDWNIKTITSYKIDELKVMSEKLGIEPCKTELCKTEPFKKLTKKDLYEQILLHFYKE